MNKQIIDNYFKDSLIEGQSIPVRDELIAYKVFNRVFDLYKFQIIKDDKDEIKVLYHKYPNNAWKTSQELGDTNTLRINSLETLSTIIEKENPWIHTLIIGSDIDTIIVGEDFHFNTASCSKYTYNYYVHCASDEVAERLSKYLNAIEITTEKGFNYITIDNQGYFGSTEFKLPTSIKVPLSNYLDDFPWNELKHFCINDEPGIFLLYGEPGCGKSYCIRKLIQDCDTTFYVLDANILGSITSAAFVDFLMDECSNCVLILEDCEKLLMDRSSSYNPFLSTVLNLSDGLLGDGLKLKFICTFNTNIQNIDPAVLRKGRLTGKYEFKKLTVNKTNELCDQLGVPRLNKESTLADIYNSQENDFSKKQTRKIGF